jgi:hypothetical protein
MNLILKKSENTVFRKIGDEYILVPIAASVADVESIFNLNETGAAIWDKIDGKPYRIARFDRNSPMVKSSFTLVFSKPVNLLTLSSPLDELLYGALRGRGGLL